MPTQAKGQPSESQFELDSSMMCVDVPPSIPVSLTLCVCVASWGYGSEVRRGETLR